MAAVRLWLAQSGADKSGRKEEPSQSEGFSGCFWSPGHLQDSQRNPGSTEAAPEALANGEDG
jgi:hypothetical protein